MSPLLSLDELRARRRNTVRLADKCGVYFLFAGDTLLYVGRTRDSLCGRLGAHLKGGARNNPIVTATGFDSCAFIPVAECDLAAVEDRYIQAFKPRANRTWGCPAYGAAHRRRAMALVKMGAEASAAWKEALRPGARTRCDLFATRRATNEH